MNTRRAGMSLCLGLAVLGAWAFPADGALVQSNFSNTTSQLYYPCSAADLVNSGQSTLASNVATPVSINYGTPAGLNDGALGTASALANTAGHDGTAGWTNTFYLNTSVNTNGYTITNLTTIAGWTGGRTTQKYELLVAFQDSPSTFHSLGIFQLSYYQASGNSSTKLQIADNSGIIAENVSAIRFAFVFIPTPDSGAIYREADVFGYPSTSTVGTAVEPVITGGTGPGGVGTTNGTSGLSFWVKADSMALTNGATVNVWPDSSGRGLHVYRKGTAAGYPAFATNLLNGQPGVRFDGTTWLSTNATFSAHEAFVVARFKLASFNAYNGILNAGDPANGVTPWLVSGDSGSTRLTPKYGDQFSLARRNGASVSVANADFAPITNTWIGTFVMKTDQTQAGVGVGAAADTVNRLWNGEIEEAITFARTLGYGLNTLQRSIVENYLSAKYGIALTSGESKYAGADVGNGNYSYDVFGIGRTDRDNQHRNSGAAGLGLQWYSGLHDGGYMFAGHKAPANSVASGRWARSWYIDGTGFTGAESILVSFGWQNAGLGNADTSMKSLLYRASESGKFQSIATGTYSGDTVTFTLLASQLADGYYTLGSISSGTIVLIR